MERTYSDMAPNMEQVVYTGDTLVLRDNDGHEFAVAAKVDEKTMAFLKAFDEWVSAKNSGTFAHGILAALWSEVERTYRDIPVAIAQDFPSIKAAALKVPRHQHA